ncbi:hypothetical protein IW152_000061 [Coemansia sp. BCRC 34962]|nr:hypothetical protein IW152_000061 [Coemansia sp. BCRC 34962]
MPRAIASLSARADAPPASDLSSRGFTDSLSSSFVGGGIGLGQPGLVARKRSLDNLENIPPTGPDRSAPATGPGIDKPSLSLLDLAAQQLSQNQQKRRRAVITASSPGGQHRMASNPRRVAQLPDNSFLRSIASIPRPDKTVSSKTQQTCAPSTVALPSTQSQQIVRPHHTPQPQASAAGNNCTNTLRHSISGGGATGAAASSRLRRLPKRNLKPLDFSGLHQPGPHHSAKLATAKSATAADATGKRTASSGSGAHSSGLAPISTNIPSLPVSPAQSSPLAILPVDGLRLPTSSPSIPLSRSTSVVSDIGGSVHPTPPNTEPRRQSAFSGLLASAYQRAATKRSSKRALCFDNSPSAEDESLRECDAVLGPRCPVIGVPGGLFETQKSGIDSLRREQNERGKSMFSDMTRTVQQAQQAFEAAVTEQSTRGRPRGRQPKASPPSTGGKTRGQQAAAATNGKGASSKRPISECKYCGKQYKYHAKLASHEQHCSSRLEALLYSADEHEQHIIHCVCGPRHDRPVGERDDLPMVQCDNCLLWLHIECVGIDEDNLPEEYFCPRCEDAFDHRRGGSGMPAAPSTPKRRNRPSAASLIMSPESSRLATLLAGVPDADADADTDTDDDLMLYKAKKGGSSLRRRKMAGSADEHYSDLSSDDTMSISMSEAAQFHRRGGGSVKACKSPIIPRMAQSEAGMSPVHTPGHHSWRVRSSVNGTSQVVLTDAPSSDFLGLPLPETIFSEKPGLAPSALVRDGSMSIATGLCSQQQSMDDLAHFLSTSQPQWSLAQLSDMLGGGAASGTGDIIGGGNNGYLDQALTDFGLGLGASGSNAGSVSATAGFDPVAAPLSELVNLPVDNDFSALLESIASGNAGPDGDPYSSLSVDGSYGGLLSDDILLDLNTCMPISGPLGAPSTVGGGRLIGPRRNSGEVNLGSSSTITLMHDTSSLCSQDNIQSATTRAPRVIPPPPARPPPGMPGMARGRSAGSTARNIVGGVSSSQAIPSIQTAASKSLGAPALSTAMSLSLSSNPPSTTGLSDLDVRQLLLGVGSSQVLDWPAEGDALELELEGLINFDA